MAGRSGGFSCQCGARIRYWAVFPHVPFIDVKKFFEIIGGVARAVFSTIELQPYEHAIEIVALRLDMGLLREHLSLSMLVVKKS